MRINIYGVPADLSEKSTKVVKDNGLNPIWNEDFKFVVNCPELAFVKFSVFDDDVGKDDLIGLHTIRFENIRQGNFCFSSIQVCIILVKIIYLFFTHKQRLSTHKTEKQVIQRNSLRGNQN